MWWELLMETFGGIFVVNNFVWNFVVGNFVGFFCGNVIFDILEPAAVINR